jgi:hypothetical protein
MSNKPPIVKLTVDGTPIKIGSPILIGDKLHNVGNIVECAINKRLAFRIYDNKNTLIREVIGSHKYIIDYYGEK